MTTTEQPVALDTSDVDRHLGQVLGGGQLKEPVTLTDIRRWVQGMQYPNPIHYEEEAAARSPIGRLVAPQSFAVCADVGHGATPAIVGAIPGTHMIFGGDEWWFFGPRIFPGDQLRQERRFVDYKVADTKFAGPTMFSRGDTVHRNQRGERVAIQRSTAVRYLASEARKRGFFEQTAPVPTWTEQQLADITDQRLRWIRTLPAEGPRTFDQTALGETLPTRPIGPHTVQSFATEWRAFIFQTWGSEVHEGYDHIPEAGWLTEMDRKVDEDARLDPSLADGLYRGPSRGHVDIEHARLVGMPRNYGYGAAMGAWILDYVSGWAGGQGFIRHSNIQYRFPPFEGDLSVLNGSVVDKRTDHTFDAALVTVEVVMANQDGTVMAKGPVEVELPA
jgi:acyl dehydratase